MKTVSREDLPDDYQEMMQTENHHDHEVIRDDQGVLRWKKDEAISEIACHRISLNDLVLLLNLLGCDKNSEIYRSLYRNMGYSLSGYWEVFYWEVNNEDADKYVQPQITNAKQVMADSDDI